MRSVLIAYEDEYFEQLHLLIKSLRRDRGLEGIILESTTVRGTGGFVGNVPKLLRLPMKQTKRPPDMVVCVGDADGWEKLAPQAPPVPAGNDAQELDTWVKDLEKSWKVQLVKDGELEESSAERLEVLCIRWSKESLLTSCPEALLQHAEAFSRRQALERFLAKCDPRPTQLADCDFAGTYRMPLRCMDDVVWEIAGRRYKKGRDGEDILRDRIRPDPNRRAEVVRRCRDIARLVDMLG